jgi:hypothetical protein
MVRQTWRSGPDVLGTDLSVKALRIFNNSSFIFRLTGFYQSVTIIDKTAIPLIKLVESGSGMHIGEHVIFCLCE